MKAARLDGTERRRAGEIIRTARLGDNFRSPFAAGQELRLAAAPAGQLAIALHEMLTLVRAASAENSRTRRDACRHASGLLSADAQVERARNAHHRDRGRRAVTAGALLDYAESLGLPVVE